MSRMNLCALAAVLASPAMAADMGAAMPYKARSSPIIEQVAYNWTGNYFGIHVGGVGGNFSFSPSASPALGGASTLFGDTSSNGNGALIAGFQVGRNWQFGSWVLGLEHDAQFTKLDDSITAGVNAFVPFAEGDSFKAKINYLGATRLKVGYTWNRFMTYVAGGLQAGHMDVTADYAPRAGTGAGAPLSFSDTHKFLVGYTVGAGAEYAISDGISLGVEYRYLALAKATYNLGTVTSAAGVVSNVTADVGLKSSQVLLRLNAKFNPFGLP